MARPRNPFEPRRASGHRNAFDQKGAASLRPRNRENEAIIADAIRQKSKIAFRYKPTDRTDRVVEPHVLWVTEAESVCLFCLQVVSEVGLAENDPKHLDPYQMTNVRLTGDMFTVDPVFKRERYSNIIAVVAR
jgi:hypothetical protein